MQYILIVCLYLLATAVIGLLASRKTRSAAAFRGTSLGTAAIVFASAGEWLGGTATTGVAEYGFTFGISGAWYTIANGIGVLFLALCFAKLYRSLETPTVPGIVEKFFGVRARVMASALLVLVMLAVGVSQMIAAGKLGQTLFGLDFRLTVSVFTVLLIGLTLMGGMNVIAATNRLHLFVMYGGILLAAALTIHRLGGWSSFVESAQALDGDYLSPTAIGGAKVSSWLIASLLGACTAQAGIQPVLAAKDVPTARRACLLTALVVAPFGLLTAALGICAKIMSVNGTLLGINGTLVTEAKLGLSALMLHLPPVAGGLVLAGILAAILSTAAPILLAASTLLTSDLYGRVLRPDADDRQLLRAGRITTAASGLLCCLAAIVLVNRSLDLDIVYAAYSLRGAVFVILLGGIYWKRATEKGACLSMVLTACTVIFWTVYKTCCGTYPIAPWLTETYAALIAAVFSMGVCSLLTGRSRPMHL
jgi:SSS family solute:Na+ symporter